jgi:hypothetical protein
MATLSNRLLDVAKPEPLKIDVMRWRLPVNSDQPKWQITAMGIGRDSQQDYLARQRHSYV